MVTKCSAIAKSGSRCTTAVVAGSAFCWMHSPEMAEARRHAARTGGRNRSSKARAAKLIPDPLSADELAGWLSRLFLDVVGGRADAKQAAAAASVARVLLEAQERADQPSVAELQEQVAALRALIERGGRVA